MCGLGKCLHKSLPVTQQDNHSPELYIMRFVGSSAAISGAAIAMQCCSCTQVKQDEDGFALTPEVPGQLMAQTYTRFATMALFVNAPEQLEMYDVLMLLAQVQPLDRLEANGSQLLTPSREACEEGFAFHKLPCTIEALGDKASEGGRALIAFICAARSYCIPSGASDR